MDRLWFRAILAAALHDLGKCCQGFQTMLRGGPRFLYRHEVFSSLFVPWVLGDDPHEDHAWVALAILTHHKDADMLAEYRDEHPDPLVLAELTPEFFEAGAGVFRDSVWPGLDSLVPGLPPEWRENLHGLVTSADPWGSLQQALAPPYRLARRISTLGANHPDALAGRFLRGLLLIADHAGSASETIRFCKALASPVKLRGLPPADGWFYHQREAAKATGNAILIAPTGSGKTESALLWAAHQTSTSAGDPVLFYVLPYQASMNAMHSRLTDLLGRESVTLQHSRALQALYRFLLDKDYRPSAAAFRARRERDLARLHSRPVRVLSPYQILRAAYQLKGHEAIWTDAAEACFVFDEIHAYEPNRLGMILATMRHLTATLGSRALVMSATLPGVLQSQLKSLLGVMEPLKADAATLDRFCRHQVHLFPGDLCSGQVLATIRRRFLGGESILVVANTVGRAQEIRDALQDLNPELLHGRFHADDRNDKEVRLRQRQGVGVSRSGSPALLIATQVVEVSLNVDFDALFTDPAPMEALFQRFGRVNRKSQAHRPPPKPVFVMSAIPEGCPVYRLPLVEAALAQLARWDGRLLLEEEVQSMLDAIYSGPEADRWSAELESARKNFEENVLATCRPFRSDDGLKQLFEKLFDGFQVLPASLEPEYRRRLDDNPLLAPALLVPVTSGQFFALLRKGRIRECLDLYIADCPYDSLNGLQLKAAPAEDGV